jgi:uncharacterized protein involved in propanediol utilization
MSKMLPTMIVMSKMTQIEGPLAAAVMKTTATMIVMNKPTLRMNKTTTTIIAMNKMRQTVDPLVAAVMNKIATMTAMIKQTLLMQDPLRALLVLKETTTAMSMTATTMIVMKPVLMQDQATMKPARHIHSRMNIKMMRKVKVKFSQRTAQTTSLKRHPFVRRM